MYRRLLASTLSLAAIATGTAAAPVVPAAPATVPATTTAAQQTAELGARLEAGQRRTEPPRDWSETLRADATSFHEQILNNHPGSVDPENPAFRRRLDAALALALDRAETVEDAGGWWWAMRALVASFDDGHVQIQLRDPSVLFPARWPGFLTIYRGPDQVVVTRDEALADLPPLGAQLVDCDDIPAARLGEERIGQFRGRWSLEAQRVAFGDGLFVDLNNPWNTELRVCRFESGGIVRSFPLSWRDISGPDLAARRAPLAQRASPRFAIRRLEEGGVWLSMPSFDGSPGGDAHTALTAMLAEAGTTQSELRTAPWVVLDVRGNGGGSSHWSRELAGILWDQDWQAAHSLPASRGVDWRASETNIAMISAYVDLLRAGGESPGTIAMAEIVVNSMRQARAAGQPYWRQPSTSEAAPVAPEAPTNPMAGRVYVLTDSACASACLDAVDLWKAMGAVQIGRETSADTVYMEVGSGELPSGLASLGIPMKVYRGRARGNNETHQPQHLFDGNMTDDAALLAWIRELTPAG